MERLSPTAPHAETNAYLEESDALAEYLEGHPSMLQGCVQQGFIHLRDITERRARKRAYSCPSHIGQRAQSHSACDTLQAEGPTFAKEAFREESHSNIALSATRNVNVLMFKPKSIAPSVPSVAAKTVLHTLQNSQYSEDYLESLVKLDRKPIRDEEPVFSWGSQFHELNTCKPCVFHWAPKGCKNGQQCPFCHHCHLPKKSKNKKKKRPRTSRRIALLAPAAVIRSYQNQSQAAITPLSQSQDSWSSTGHQPTDSNSPHRDRQRPLCCPILCEVSTWKEIAITPLGNTSSTLRPFGQLNSSEIDLSSLSDPTRQINERGSLLSDSPSFVSGHSRSPNHSLRFFEDSLCGPLYSSTTRTSISSSPSPVLSTSSTLSGATFSSQGGLELPLESAHMIYPHEDHSLHSCSSLVPA
eukprot:GHVN01019840.1.p2 GENE.GHVN01019840.1~~GHVN01019840.1.p2  ORF type:complete len:413 (-),score=31.65 GHVN01019840.1:3702-4940(-)